MAKWYRTLRPRRRPKPFPKPRSQVRKGCFRAKLVQHDREDSVTSALRCCEGSQGKRGFVDGTLTTRFEFKYMIARGLADQIRRYLEPFVCADPFTARSPNSSYPISSLYLDSPSLHLYRTTIEGHRNRMKLRIRTYTDGADEPAFLEVKKRSNLAIMKVRAKVPRSEAMGLVAGRQDLVAGVADTELHKAHEFANLSMLWRARPVMRVRYRREAYESNGQDPVRVTFDTDLAYAVTPNANLSHNGTGWERAPMKGLIFEVKFTNRAPSWVVELIRRFDLQSESVPKYVISVDSAREAQNTGLTSTLGVYPFGSGWGSGANPHGAF